MRIHKLNARSLLGSAETPHFHAFRLALLVAIGQQLAKGSPPFDFISNKAYQQLTCQFWPDSHLVAPQVHTVVTMRTKDRLTFTPAFLQIDTEYCPSRHRRPPCRTIIELPDDLLGVSLFDPERRSSTYTSLLWNLTPGEYNGNLYDALQLLASAYAHVEGPLFHSFHDMHPAPQGAPA